MAQYPELNYRPIALPENWGDLAINLHTKSFLQMVFVLLNQMAPSLAELLALPTVWTSWPLAVATNDTITEVDIIPGDEAIPVPFFDYIGGRPQRAIQMIPLLAGLGISSGMAAGTPGIGTRQPISIKSSFQLSVT